jgi:hypothetical protein
MSDVLVVANQTLGGAKLLDAVRAHAQEGARFRLVVPLTKPSAGLVIYDDAVRDAAQVRIDLAMSVLASEGIESSGEIGDPDPFSATMDAVAEHRPDAIILSTHPATSSGWLRRDLIERIESATGLPVEHIVTDLDAEEVPFQVTLVVANRTSSGQELLEHLREKAAHGERHLFIAVVPQQDGRGGAAREARERLAAMLDHLQDAGMLASGMIGDPDPYTATVNALALFRVDDVVISTLPDERSGWMRADLIERVKRVTAVPVEHVVVEVGSAAPAAAG